MKKTIALSAISAAALTGFAYSEIESNFHVGYNSTYVFRGLDLGDNMFEYGLDFGGTGDCGLDWNAGIWYASAENNGVTGVGGDIDELDIYASVGKDLGFGALELGVIHYTYGDDLFGGDASEVFLGASTSFAGLELGAKLYYRFNSNANPYGFGGANNETLWGQLTADYSYKVSEQLSLIAGLTLGATLDADGGENYTTYGARIGADYAVGNGITLSPYVAYSDANGEGALPGNSGFYGGVRVGFNF